MIPGIKMVPAFVKPAGSIPAHTADPVASTNPQVKGMPPGAGRVLRKQQAGLSLQPTGTGASQPARTSGSVLGKRHRDDGPAPGVFDAKHASSESDDIEEILRQMVEEMEAPIPPGELESLSRQPLDLSWLEEPVPHAPVVPPARLMLDAGAGVVWVQGEAKKLTALQSCILATLLQDKGRALMSNELAQRFGVKDSDAANACSRLLEICGKDNFCNDRGLGYYIPGTVTGGLVEATAAVDLPALQSSSVHSTGDKRMALDVESQTVRLAGKPDPVELTATQCALVRALLQQKGGVLTKEALAKELDLAPKSVPNLIKEVRKACGRNSILAVYGKGYYILDRQTRLTS